MNDIELKIKSPRRPHDLTPSDRARIIRQLEFGASLSDRTVAEFARSSVVLEARRRRFVYRAGEQADALYVIVKGRIKLCRIEPNTDREAVIDILPQGSLFGDSALYSTCRPPGKLCGRVRIMHSTKDSSTTIQDGDGRGSRSFMNTRFD